MKKILFIAVILIFVFPIYNTELSKNSVHISLLQGKTEVYHSDNSLSTAKLNTKILPGDTIITGKDGLCEIQFPNGTLMRINRESDLTLISDRLKTATSRRSVTTIKLIRGSIYSMSQNYRREIFQIVTDLLALKSGGRATILTGIFSGGENFVNIIRGKADVRYGKNRSTRMSKGEKFIFLNNGKKNILTVSYWNDFIEKNRNINRNFKELHYGKSDVPAKLYRYSKGLVLNREKYGDKFGKWKYTERFGYVWIPYDFSFIPKRPFQDANYVEIDGEIALVPNQMYGWAPYLLGNWIWNASKGWIWIPGKDDLENLNYTLDYRNYYLRNLIAPGNFLYVWQAGLLNNLYFSKVDFPRNSIPLVYLYHLNPRWRFKLEKKKLITTLKYDWNPDARLKKRIGIKLKYVSSKNDAVLTVLNRSIKDLNGLQKFGLKSMIISPNGRTGEQTRLKKTGVFSTNGSASGSNLQSASSSGVQSFTTSGGSTEGRGTGGGSKKN